MRTMTMHALGKKIGTILKQYQGPTLIYDLNCIRTRMIFLSELCLEKNITPLFTVKSFPFGPVLSLAHEIMPGFEVSNLSEYALLPKNVSNKYISINDPTQQFGWNIAIPTSDSNHYYIHLDSVNEETFKTIKKQDAISYGLRIAHSSLIDTANTYVLESRFGVNIQDLSLHKNLFLEEKLSGLHVHNGSENNSLADYEQMIDQIFYYLDKAQIPISFLNLGGGLHKLSDQALQALMLSIHQKTAGRKIHVFFEPGHILSQKAGYALGKILSIKKMNHQYYLTLDLSRKCHLKWSDPRYLPLETPPETFDPPGLAVKVHFGSPTCFEHDHIQTIEIPLLNQALPFKEGQIILFSHVNGYSAAWNTSFNGIQQAQVFYLDSALD